MAIRTIGDYFPIMGSDVEVRVHAASTERAKTAERAAVDELTRLEAVFNLLNQTSALNRWRQHYTSDIPPELVSVLRVAQEWFEASGGAFHPATAPLRRRWLRAEDAGKPPTRAEMRALAEQLPGLPYHVDDAGVVHRLAGIEAVDLNAVARGFIIDRAAEVALHCETVCSVTITAGGVLRHLGDGAAEVPIPGSARHHFTEDDACITIRNRGLSMSGPLRPGFFVAGQWYPQLFDPRTGWPVPQLDAVGVIAPDALTAHLTATVIKVHPDGAADFLAARGQVDVLAVLSDDRAYRSATWPG